MKKLIDAITSLLGKKPKKVKELTFPNKNPNDFSLTLNSTEWWNEEYYCPRCKCETNEQEYINGFCTSCGYVGSHNRNRLVRMIIQNNKWVVQYKYKNGDIEIKEDGY